MNSQTPPPLPSYNTFCQGCQVCAPTKHVSFQRNIGCLVMRFPGSIEGELCRSCVNEHFSKATLITSFLGWWGVISAICTPFILATNVIQYLCCLSLKPGEDQPARGTALAYIALVIGLAALAVPVYVIYSIMNSSPR